MDQGVPKRNININQGSSTNAGIVLKGPAPVKGTDTFKLTAVIAGTVVVSVGVYYFLKKFYLDKKGNKQVVKGGRYQQAGLSSSTASGGTAGASNISSVELSKEFIREEMARLQDPQLSEDGLYLQKRDFFDLLMLIQLKTKIKLQKEVRRNQRERIKLLEQALNENQQSEQAQTFDLQYQQQIFITYIEKTMEIMQKEFDQYEDQLQKILTSIGITNDTWEASRELYIQINTEEGGHNYTDEENRADDYFGETSGGDLQSIENIDKQVYEYLPKPQIPKSLTKEKAKSIMIDVNHRAFQIFKNYMRSYVTDNYPPEYEPLLMETLAFDLTFHEYGINENVFRFAIHKYELQKDLEIKEYLEEYLQS